MSLLFLCSLCFIVLDHQYKVFEPLRQVASVCIEPLYRLVDWPFRCVQAVRAHHHIWKRNQGLEVEALLQAAQLQQLAALGLENTRLRSLLNVQPRSGETFMMAEILEIQSDPLVQRIVINRGAKDGAFIGQALIDATGVLGEIIETMPHTSRAIVLSDSSYGIPVENARTGLRGIVVGKGPNQPLALQHVPNTIDLEVGDLLMTSGLEGHYPAGYPVGIVQHIRQEPGESFATVQVTPLANYRNNRSILLIHTTDNDAHSVAPSPGAARHPLPQGERGNNI